MTAGPRHRIAVLQTHPIQYYVPLYAALDREDDFEVTVFYLSDVSVRGGRDPGFGVDVAWDIDLLSGYRAVFAKDASRRGVGGFFSLAGLDVFEPIRRGAFDALLVHGHNLAATFVAIAAAKASGTPILMRGDSHLRLPHGGLRGAVRGRALTALYAAVDGFLAIGTANRAYYRSFGVPDDKISLVPFAVRVERRGDLLGRRRSSTSGAGRRLELSTPDGRVRTDHGPCRLLSGGHGSLLRGRRARDPATWRLLRRLDHA